MFCTAGKDLRHNNSFIALTIHPFEVNVSIGGNVLPMMGLAELASTFASDSFVSGFILHHCGVQSVVRAMGQHDFASAS